MTRWKRDVKRSSGKMEKRTLASEALVPSHGGDNGATILACPIGDGQWLDGAQTSWGAAKKTF